MTELVARELALADRLVPQDGAQASPDNAAIQRTLADGQGLLDRLRNALDELGATQAAMVGESEAELDRRRRLLRPIILMTLFGGLAAALAAGWWFATDIAARVSALERNAERLANGERLHYEPSRGLDEIGSLDLTLRRAALRLRTRERELRDVNARLERTVHEQVLLNRELEAFSYSVSHDLRAPLRSIDGFAQALRDDWGDKLDETAQDHLSRVRNAAQRMGRLIDDLLKLSRLTRAQIQRMEVNLSKTGPGCVCRAHRPQPHARGHLGHRRGTARLVRPRPGAHRARQPARKCVEVHIENERCTDRVRRGAREPPQKVFSCATMEPDSTCGMSKNCSRRSSACMASASFRGRESGWQLCSASSTSTAAR